MALCPRPVYQPSVGGLRPCGYCPDCREKRRREKTARIVLEGKAHEHCLFVTLTYDDLHLPREWIDNDTGEIVYAHPDGVLDYRHVQLLNKKILRTRPPKSVRFFCCGEYGEKHWRPHFHLVYWGIPWKDRAVFYDKWSDPYTGYPLCDPRRLDIQVPKKEWDVAAYCASYVTKQLTNPKTSMLNGRSPELAKSSKGIGLSFVDNYAQALNSVSGRAYIRDYGDIPRTLQLEGKNVPLDRYMREKIIDKLQITEQAKATASAKFDQEMRDLQIRALANPEISKTEFLDLQARNLVSKHKDFEHWAMERQAAFDRAQQAAQAQRKRDLYNSRKGDF